MADMSKQNTPDEDNHTDPYQNCGVSADHNMTIRAPPLCNGSSAVVHRHWKSISAHQATPVALACTPPVGYHEMKHKNIKSFSSHKAHRS